MPRSRWSIDRDSVLYLATSLTLPTSPTMPREPINPSHSFLDTETSPSKSSASMTGVHLHLWLPERLGSSPRAPSSPSKQPTTRITQLQKVLRLFFLSELTHRRPLFSQMFSQHRRSVHSRGETTGPQFQECNRRFASRNHRCSRQNGPYTTYPHLRQMFRHCASEKTPGQYLCHVWTQGLVEAGWIH
jgi:hypothetical protein